MKESLLWNGFELKKGKIATKYGDVPYLFYSPEITNEVVNVAIHGEGHDKDDWLSFNSVLKLGNLLKESIKHNSPFIAFDLYGHGDWIIDNKNFNITNLSTNDKIELIQNSCFGIQEAIPQILKEGQIENNPLSISAFSVGCSVALGLDLQLSDFKMILISPFKAAVSSKCKEILVIRGRDDRLVSEDDINTLLNSLPNNTQVELYNSEHEIPVSWINRAKEFIY